MTFDKLPEPIRNFLERCLPIIQEHPHLEGLAAGGSFITQTMDAYSDLDLVLAVTPTQYDSFFSQIDSFLAQFGSLLACFNGTHVGEPRLLVCIYQEALLHVDFKVIQTQDFAQRVEDPVILWERDGCLSAILRETAAHFPCPGYQWWENRFWTWVYYLSQKLARGEWFECMDGLAFLRNTVLGPMIQVRHGQQPRGVRHIERIAPDQLPQLLATLASYDAASLKKAVLACCDLYRSLRQDAPSDLIRKQDMEHAALNFLEGLPG